MKTIYKLMSLLAVFAGLIACNTDQDSNPTLNVPASFTLNTPPYASGVYDLKSSETVQFTATQPDYGFTAATTYRVQVSLTDEYKDESGDTPATYATLPLTYTNAVLNVPAEDIAVAIVELLGVTEEENFPDTPLSVYVRLRASLYNDNGVTYSNSINLPQVKSYFALSAVEYPDNMYLIGSINGWSWENAIKMIPTHSHPETFWKIQYFEAGSEIKFNGERAWDGNDIGFNNATFPATSIEFADLSEEGGNIRIGKGGWYLVIVNMEIEGRDILYTVEFQEALVYLVGDVIGGTWGTERVNSFTIPATEDGDFVSPAFPTGGELRICVKLENAEWWQSEFLVFDGEIVYRATGDDQERVPVSAGQKAYLNFTTGFGSIK